MLKGLKATAKGYLTDGKIGKFKMLTGNGNTVAHKIFNGSYPQLVLKAVVKA